MTIPYNLINENISYRKILLPYTNRILILDLHTKFLESSLNTYSYHNNIDL
jgi:hypothetical protein